MVRHRLTLSEMALVSFIGNDELILYLNFGVRNDTTNGKRNEQVETLDIS
jgi:hypothetical protein